MANEQSGSPLRRWRPFYGAFAAIDDAIEAAAAGAHPRAAFRDARDRIVAAEQLCAKLDDAMVEALETLRVVVPVPVSTDLARAVGALRNHGSARIRGLAGDVVRGWKTGSVAATATTSVKEEMKEEELPLLSVDRIPRQGIPKVVSKMEAKKPIAADQSEKMEAKKQLIVTQSETKMETTKRKLREAYEEAVEVKRQHSVKKIEDKEAPNLWEQSQRKMQHAQQDAGSPQAFAVLCFPLQLI